VQRQVRLRLRPPPRSRVFAENSWLAANSPELAGLCACVSSQRRGICIHQGFLALLSLALANPFLARVPIRGGVVFTRSSRASHVGETIRQAHRAIGSHRCHVAGDLLWQPSRYRVQEMREIYSQIDLAHTAAFALRNRLDIRFCIDDKLVEPTASAGYRRDQRCAGFGSNRTRVLRQPWAGLVQMRTMQSMSPLRTRR
jgi:hypothetical protein